MFTVYIYIYIYVYYQSNFKKSHVVTVKRFFRYLINTQDVGLWYSKQSSFDLIGIVIQILLVVA